jgi:hypothetical protein
LEAIVNSSITVHDVKAVTLKKITDFSGEGFYVRDLVIHGEDGSRCTLKIFSEDRESLELKEKE